MGYVSFCGDRPLFRTFAETGNLPLTWNAKWLQTPSPKVCGQRIHRRIFVNWKPSPHFISQEMAPSLRFGRLGSRSRCSSRAITDSSSIAQGLHRFLYDPIEIYVSFPPIWIVLNILLPAVGLGHDSCSSSRRSIAFDKQEETGSKRRFGYHYIRQLSLCFQGSVKWVFSILGFRRLPYLLEFVRRFLRWNRLQGSRCETQFLPYERKRVFFFQGFGRSVTEALTVQKLISSVAMRTVMVWRWNRTFFLCCHI